jgi:dihydrofolate synthase / folylpolyglutamate synthase
MLRQDYMNIRTLRTHKITAQDRDLLAILDQHLAAFREGEILAITSKIVAITQGRIIPVTEADFNALVRQEADAWLPPDQSRYGVWLTIKGGLLIPNAGVDESNANGCYVLWPHEIAQVANQVRHYLCQRFGLTHAGVLITDSRPLPLRWGVTGMGVAHSGFRAINNLVGQADLFGRPLRMTKVNVVDGLAAAAVLAMGEGAEQTPLAVISELPFVYFEVDDPTPAALAAMNIAPEDDLYAPLLTAVQWLKT